MKAPIFIYLAKITQIFDRVKLKIKIKKYGQFDPETYFACKIFLKIMLTMKMSLFLLLAWEPSVAQGIHSYHAVYPRLVIFFPIKVNPINLDSKTMLRTSPWFSRVPPNKTWDKSVNGILNYYRTNKQMRTNRTYLALNGFYSQYAQY